MELKNFQVDAIAELNAAMAKDDVRDIVLKSPTGSGKTIILTRFMQDYMRDNPATAFVWLTPGKGELEEQSRAKMDRYCHNAATKGLADVMTCGFAAGDAVFVNWEKLTKDGNNALKESERTNFADWIEKARGEGVAFKVVIDESHQNATVKSAAVVDLFKTDKIVRASATPEAVAGATVVEVREADVIAEGLIKKTIYVNPDFPLKIALADDDAGGAAYLLERAMARREELRRAFLAQGSEVNPLVVVQLPNNSDAQLDAVEAWFAKRGVGVEDGRLAVWLANRHDNLEGLAANDGGQVAVVIKQAVATGWDCPRAHILVKLRDNMDETFEIQTIGRIRRMPEARHYEDALLDGCYLYTFDEKFRSELCQRMGGRAFDARQLALKPEHKAFSLVKEQVSMVAGGRDPTLAQGAVFAQFRKAHKVGADAAQNAKRLAADGYDLQEGVVNWTQTGAVAQIAELAKGAAGFDDVAVTQKMNTHRFGRQFHHAAAEIGAACGLRYEACREILFRLFGDREATKERILSLTVGRLYSFVLNNKARLKDAFREAMADGASGGSKAACPVVEKEFRFLQSWVMTFDAKSRDEGVRERNVYAGYLCAARPRSKGEVKFERWCEAAAGVDWFYRNGDKGDEFFSIAYADNAGKPRLFYPDYVVSRGGETWIFEVKGGWTPSGESENIDLFAAKKAEALKAYCAKHGLRGGFVCYDEKDDLLLVSEDGYSDDVSAPCWKKL